MIANSLTPVVSLVIVTHNRAQYLRRTLQSLKEQTVLSSHILSIVLVDNASTDGTVHVLNEFSREMRQLHIVRTLKNIGGSGGFALGIETAMQMGAKWIGVCDDDVVFAPDAIENIIKHAQNHSILNCLRLNKEGEVVERASRYYDLSNPFLINPKRKSLCEDIKRPDDLQPLESVAFSSFEGMFFPSHLIEEIGLPAREFFIFGDDCDFCLRAKKNGWNIFIVRDARLIRQIEYNRKAMLHSWKCYYVLRNFFVLHFVHGENFFVRLKPFVLLPCLVIYLLISRANVNPFSALCSALKLADLLKSRAKLKEVSKNEIHS